MERGRPEGEPADPAPEAAAEGGETDDTDDTGEFAELDAYMGRIDQEALDAHSRRLDVPGRLAEILGEPVEKPTEEKPDQP